jgi:hypothetical protein
MSNLNEVKNQIEELKNKKSDIEKAVKIFLGNSPLGNTPKLFLKIMSVSPNSNKITSPCPMPKSLIVEVEFPTGFREIREFTLIVSPALYSTDCMWMAYYSYPEKNEYVRMDIPDLPACGKTINEALINLTEILIEKGII